MIDDVNPYDIGICTDIGKTILKSVSDLVPEREVYPFGFGLQRKQEHFKCFALSSDYSKPQVQFESFERNLRLQANLRSNDEGEPKILSLIEKLVEFGSKSKF